MGWRRCDEVAESSALPKEDPTTQNELQKRLPRSSWFPVMLVKLQLIVSGGGGTGQSSCGSRQGLSNYDSQPPWAKLANRGACFGEVEGHFRF